MTDQLKPCPLCNSPGEAILRNAVCCTESWCSVSSESIDVLVWQALPRVSEQEQRMTNKKTIAEDMTANGEGWALSARAEIEGLLKERDSLKAQFSEIAAIEGLTESEDGLPGSVRDLVVRLTTQRDNYKRWYQESDARLERIQVVMGGYDN